MMKEGVNVKYLIWGAGDRAERIFYHIGADKVVAFIDSDSDKIGKKYLEKEILSLEDVKRYNLQYCIVISPLFYEDDITRRLESEGINYYLLLKECPGDFQDPYPRDCLKNYVLELIKSDLQYVVYGSTLYSLKVYEWIKEKCFNNPFLLVPENTNDGLIKLLRQELKESLLTSLPNNLRYDVIFDTERKVLQKAQCKRLGIDFSKKEDIFDCAEKIDEYYNEKICQFKNIHKDKRCFIIALGPSLKIRDLDRLHDNQEICISMNTIWKAFEQTKWRPMYYVADDYRVMREQKHVLNYMKNGYCFIGDTNPEFCKDINKTENVLIHHVNQEISEDRPGKFSDDYSRNSYLSSTVTSSCIQLAVYMGIKEIYLLGVDFSYSGSGSKIEKYGHFYSEDKTSTLYVRSVYMGYLGAKNYADEHGIKIYNATRGGKLEVFERVDFDSLF